MSTTEESRKRLSAQLRSSGYTVLRGLGKEIDDILSHELASYLLGTLKPYGSPSSIGPTPDDEVISLYPWTKTPHIETTGRAALLLESEGTEVQIYPGSHRLAFPSASHSSTYAYSVPTAELSLPEVLTLHKGDLLIIDFGLVFKLKKHCGKLRLFPTSRTKEGWEYHKAAERAAAEIPVKERVF